MIEVEKKFKLNDRWIEKIQHEGIFIGREKLYDIYYDTDKWCYTLQNMWLRKRGDFFELKVGVQKKRGLISHYYEITDAANILQAMKLSLSSPLPAALEKHKITPFCSFKTDRRKYRLGEFTIVIDTASLDDIIYSVGEIELLVAHESKIPEADAKIIAILDKEAIDWRTSVPGKLPFFLFHKHPMHYLALVNAQIVEDDMKRFYFN